ncbi:hypothetical protein AX16_004369 [Volvariella volvacea WC 439]|nr:hypothetical protein AX16_004369 [Volvariella volvacea WC 439]
MPPPAPRTPLRRVSQGSLFALSRSNQDSDAPHGLGFLEPAMAELVEEVETLQTNVEAMKRLSESLATFNESFASWLYIMRMNSLTTDWPQAPIDESYELAKQRTADRKVLAEIEAMQEQLAKAAAAPPLPEVAEEKTMMTDADTTFAANTTITAASAAASSNNKPGGQPKKKGKARMTAKEKKERSMELERIISCLPLEFRGSDPNLRRSMEAVIEGLMDAPDQTVKLYDLIKPPDLSQARVNKCLIALVNRKVVRKDNSTGTVLYHWQGLP